MVTSFGAHSINWINRPWKRLKGEPQNYFLNWRLRLCALPEGIELPSLQYRWQRGEMIEILKIVTAGWGRSLHYSSPLPATHLDVVTFINYTNNMRLGETESSHFVSVSWMWGIVYLVGWSKLRILISLSTTWIPLARQAVMRSQMSRQLQAMPFSCTSQLDYLSL